MKVTHWPLHGLRVRTPRLELRLPTPDELDELAELSAQGIHQPGTMPFAVPWTDQPPAGRARSVMQFHWRTLGEWTPQDWTLPLVILLDGTVVGSQSLTGRAFPIMREVETGSWLGLRHQGQGIGTEMRAAAVHLAFAGLNAESAVTAAMTDNPASITVSNKIGYRRNGLVRTVVGGTLRYKQHFALDRDAWEAHRTVPVEIDGLEPCLPQFGL
ncbi:MULTISPECIES: GNAT family N-acetyltransferase [Thermomonosporaceae]|uniref:GNAT family N-acetyltransferase n=1 Tax=Thermomonosporaceae TaxID=2012 RepID=UPI00255AC3B5|nr:MULTISPECIES: GNAT family N-acetyltransferase [Thermomonosporaceae]MDL4773648.1 GNAT family N-acetyltransferase [Actinomadura xylanilytica]